MKKHYRTVMISDTHLCSRDCRVAEIEAFLKSVKCEYLYIVGDFIDIWQLRRKWLWTQEYNNILRRILGMAKKGTQVFYIPGNHDDMIRHFTGVRFGGIEIVANRIHETADGKRLLVTHGDEFDGIIVFNKWLAYIGSIAYDYLIYFNTLINGVRRVLGMDYWSFAACIKRRIKNADVYIGKFKQVLMDETKRRGLDGAVCGHIHTPELCLIDNLIYANTGDWVDSCTALVEYEDGRLEIIRS